MSATSWLEIDLDRLDANVAAMRRVLGPGPGICAVVKADAYGLGAIPVARRLERSGIEMLAVYAPDQAAHLWAAGIRTPLLIFMPARGLALDGELAAPLRQGRLHLSVHHPDELADLDDRAAALGVPIPVHLHLDTGMSRAGLDTGQLAAICRRRSEWPGLRLAGLYTHFAAAEDDLPFTRQQMAAFAAAVRPWRSALGPDLLVHAANTFAAHRDRGFHLSMVRTGLGLYGYGPQLMSGELAVRGPTVQPIVRWVSRIVHVRRYPAGATVGYNRTHRLDRDSRLALVPAGYADGYPLGLGNRALVRVRPADAPPVDAPVRGKVNMDQIVIDLTDAPAAAGVGTEIELISGDLDAPCALPRLAALAGSSCYEMLCRLSSRLPRRYTG